jgi:CHAT domain-containing protein/tetratricopeptide (TPR) repeat protein
MKYFSSLLFLVSFFFYFSCQTNPIQNTATENFTPKGIEDSISIYVNTTFDQYYYEYKYDSTQVMDILIDYEKNTTNALALANIEHTKGKVQYTEQAYDQAIIYYKKSLEIRKKHLDEFHEDIIRGYHNISLCYDLLHENYNALEYSTKAAKNLEETPSKLKASVYHQLSRTYKKVQDLDNAKIYLEDAIAIYAMEKEKSTGKEKRSWEKSWGIACHDMATLLYNRLKDTPESPVYLNNVLSVFSQLSKDNSYSGHLANGYHNAGIYYDELGDLNTSLHYYNRSLDLNKSLKSRSSFIGTNLVNMGIIYKRKNQLKEAKKTAYQALTYFNPKKDQLNIASIYDNLGDIFKKDGDLDSALTCYNIAIKNIVAGYDFDKNNPTSNLIIDANTITDKNGLFITLSSKADALRQYFSQTKNKKWLQASFDTYLKVDSLADLMRLEFSSDASKESLVARTKPVYEKAINLCLKMKEVYNDGVYNSHAFNFAEKSKSIILLEAVRKAKAKLIVDEQLIEQEKALNLKQNFYEKEYALALIRADAKTQPLLDSLSKYRTKYNEILQVIAQSNPTYLSLKKNTNTIDWTEVQKNLLNDDQSFIEYFNGDSAIYAFVINKNSFQSFKINLDTPIDSLVNQLNRGILKRQTKGYATAAANLYAKIFEPIRAACGTSKHLIIAPDGILSHIPFEALLTQKVAAEEEQYFKDYPYLINDFIISYNYSASLWNEMKQKEIAPNEQKLFAGFAPAFPKNTNINLEISNDFSVNFGELKWNIEEVNAIQNKMEGDIFATQKATVENFRKYAPQYRILHLSTHGKANDKAGDFSCLVFNGKNGKGFEYFYTKDLYALQLNAELVVLSACETNIGELKEGEGIISLARGFSYAGAASIITTLWVVDDEISKKLMVDFYAAILNHKNKAEALHQVKKSYFQKQKLNRKAHPYYWASFIPIGDMRAIALEVL